MTEEDAKKIIHQLNLEIKRLREGYELSEHSSRACPGCVYDNGRFIRECRLHATISALQAQISEMRK
jgi:hypothetical protein